MTSAAAVGPHTVDQFLDEVEAELARLTKENDDLRSKLSAAQSGAPAQTAPIPVQKAPEPEPVREPEPEPVKQAPAPAVERPPARVVRSTGGSQSLERGMRLLRAFLTGASELTNAELAERWKADAARDAAAGGES